MTTQLTRREMLRLWGALAAGSVLAGCAPPAAEETPTPTAPPVEGNVTVMTLRNELTEEEQAQFEESHPGITIEFLPHDEGRFLAAVAAGDPPDLVRVLAPDVPRYLARDIPLDLTAYFEASPVLDPDDLAPACACYRAESPLEVGSGPIYGLPKDWSPDLTLFLNVETFGSAGLEVPPDDSVLTYWEVADLARQMARFEGDQVLAWGYAYSDFWQEGVWENMLLEVGKSLYGESMATFSADEDVEAVIRYYYDLAVTNVVANPRHPSTSWSGGDFGSGLAGIGQFGYWFAPFVYGTKVEGKVRMLPAPMWAGERRNPTISGAGTVMAAATDVPDAAWQVFEWYHGLEPAVTRAANGLGVPALTSLYDLLPRESAYQQQTWRVVQGEVALATPPIQFNPFASAPVAAAYAANLEAALLDEITFDEFFAAIGAEVNRAIAEGIERL